MQQITIGLILLTCSECRVFGFAGTRGRQNLQPLPPHVQTPEALQPNEADGLPKDRVARAVFDPTDLKAARAKCHEGLGANDLADDDLLQPDYETSQADHADQLDTATLFSGLTLCHTETQKYNDIMSSGKPFAGLFKPDCDADGNYMPVQCKGSQCYCANHYSGVLRPYFGCYDRWHKDEISCTLPSTTDAVPSTTARMKQYQFLTTTKRSNKKADKEPKNRMKFTWDLNSFLG